jgi:uncharacterized protein
MLVRILGAAAVMVMLATPAFAFHCPKDMAKIDAAMAANPDISDADKAKVTELRQKGEELHKAGNHQESVDTLAEAMAILGIE